EAHVDHIDGILDAPVPVGIESPLDGVCDEIGGTGHVSEHLQGVQLGAGSDALADGAGGEAGGRGGDMGAVAVDLERIVIGLRGEIRVRGVVIRAGEVVAADHRVVGKAVLAHRFGRVVVGVVGGIAATPQGGVGVVDSRVDDGDRGAFAGQFQV